MTALDELPTLTRGVATIPDELYGRLGAGVLLGELEPGTPEWIAARARRIGGSEIAVVLGLSPWESYFGLWHRKRGTIGPIEDNVLLRMGRRLEDDIADEFAFQNPEFELHTCPAYTHPDRDWQAISPDRVAIHRETGEWVPVEIKHPHGSDEWGATGTDEIPIYYRCQVLQAMDVLEIDRHLLAAYFGGDDFRTYEIRYDEHEAQILRRRGGEFIDHVAAGAPLPSIDEHSATYQALRELHPDIDGTDLRVPAAIAEPYLASRQLLAEAKEEAQLQTSLLAEHMGSARRALYGLTKAGNPRSIACRMASGPDALPYLKASPLPKTPKEIT